MRIKILINQIIIALISSIIIGGLLYILIEANYTNIKTENLKSNEVLISSIIDNELEKGSISNYYIVAQTLSQKLGYRITLFDVEGFPISDSINNSILLNEITPEDNFNLTLNKYTVKKLFSPEVGRSYFYLYLPSVEINDKTVFIRIGEPNGLIDTLMNNIIYYIAVSLFLGIIISSIIALVTSKNITLPLKQLESAAIEIDRGNLGAFVSVNSTDEINRLANSFNRMSSKIKYLVGDLSEQNIQKESILTSIEDGIIAINTEGKLLFVNKSLYEILDIEEDIQSFGDFAEISKHIFRDVAPPYEITSPGFAKEIKYSNNKIIYLSTYPIKTAENGDFNLGSLITVRDLTKLRTYETLREDFVANISHELRTPLTSISGFLEMLENKPLDDEMKTKSIKIMKIELKRLYGLIDKMLFLSRIERIGSLSRERIDIIKIISDAKILLRQKAFMKKMKIRLVLNRPVINFYGDSELIKLILINLLENSIIYGKQNGLIQIKIFRYENSILISVKDNGMGIPDDDLPFIFERFYRAEHTKNMGNKQTGLGLSIVKSIVESLDGKISVYSKLGEGTETKIFLYDNKHI